MEPYVVDNGTIFAVGLMLWLNTNLSGQLLAGSLVIESTIPRAIIQSWLLLVVRCVRYVVEHVHFEIVRELLNSAPTFYTRTACLT